MQRTSLFLILPVVVLLILFCTEQQGSLRRDNPFDSQGTNWNPPTVVMFTGDTSVSIFDTLTLSAMGSGKDTVINYVWAAHDGTFADTTKAGSFRVAFPDSGRKIVLVNVLDKHGVACISPDTCIIAVALDPPAVKMTPRDTTMSINDSVTLTAAGAGKHRVVEYLWAKNGNSFTDTTAAGAFRVTYPDSGKHFVLVKSVDTYGLLSKSDTCIARVTLDAPTVRMKMHDTATGIRDTVALAAVGMGRHGVVKYVWAKNGKTFMDTTTTGSFLVAYPDSGKHLVLVISVDKYGLLSKPDSCLVRVKHGPPILTHVHDTTVSQSATVTINVTAVDTSKNSRIQKYFWDVGANGWDDSTNMPTHNFSYPTGGPTKIVWGARDDDGFMTSDTFVIRYNRPPVIVSVTEPTAVTAWTQFDDRFYYGTEKGNLPLAFLATDADLPNETLTFWVSVKSSADTVSQVSCGTSSGSSAMVTQYVLFSAGINVTLYWKILVRDIFGDSAVSTGSFVAPPSPGPQGMKLIPGGTFQMGSNDTADYKAQPAHVVTLSPFYMDSTDVTEADYLAIMDMNPSVFTGPLEPVEQTTWFDAALYCNERSKRDGLDTVYSYSTIIFVNGSPGNGCSDLGGLKINFSRWGYRLPTEAEWEYACRGGTSTEYFWSNDTSTTTIGQYAWYYTIGKFYPQVVAQKLPNPYGLYDMAGNVWKWCNDWYGVYAAGPQTNPQGAPTGFSRVMRGGAWDTDDYHHCFRSACRYFRAPNYQSGDGGFRCVLSFYQ